MRGSSSSADRACERAASTGRLTLSRRQKLALVAGGGAGLLAFAGILYVFRDKVSEGFDVLEKEAFRAALLTGTPHGRTAAYTDELWQVAQETGVSAFLLAAVMERESGSGVYLTPPGPNGTGDGGHGRGLMQLDDRTTGGRQGQVLSDGSWTDPYTNISVAATEHIVPDTAYFQKHGLTGSDLIRAVLASYNAGPGNVLKAIQAGKDPDSVTTGKNYGTATFATITRLASAAGA